MARVSSSSSRARSKSPDGKRRSPSLGGNLRGKAVLPSLKPSAWMNPTLRCWLVALRPWSFPASIVPCATAGALLHRRGGHDLMTLKFAMSIVCVLLCHGSGNLINTYFDFRKGCDTKALADDRALVDGTVSPSSVFAVAIAMLLASLATGAWLASSCPDLLWLCVAAAGLAVFYTADPFSLKYHGLGTLTIFVCFGPFLMQGVSLVVSGQWDLFGSVGYFSVPVGLLTVGILHANDHRDVQADRAAGVTTLAQVLGPGLSSIAFSAFVFLPYALVAAASLGLVEVEKEETAGRSSSLRVGLRPLLMVSLCLPWARYLVCCFREGGAALKELPQRTAQHNLMWGTALTLGLSPMIFVGRVCLGCLFYLGGVNNIIMWRYAVVIVSEKMANIVPLDFLRSMFISSDKDHVLVAGWLAHLALAIAVVAQLVSSVAFMFGIQPVLSAKVMLVFLVPITFIVHDLWTVEFDVPLPSTASGAVSGQAVSQGFESGGHGGVTRHVPNFAMEFDNEFVHFFKNIGMIGGLILYIEMSGGF